MPSQTCSNSGLEWKRDAVLGQGFGYRGSTEGKVSEEDILALSAPRPGQPRQPVQSKHFSQFGSKGVGVLPKARYFLKYIPDTLIHFRHFFAWLLLQKEPLILGYNCCLHQQNTASRTYLMVHSTHLLIVQKKKKKGARTYAILICLLCKKKKMWARTYAMCTALICSLCKERKKKWAILFRLPHKNGSICSRSGVQ